MIRSIPSTILLAAFLAPVACFDRDSLAGLPCTRDDSCGVGLICVAEQCAEPVAADLPIGLGVGAYHSCAVMGSGSVRCWGSNDWEQLGYPDHREMHGSETYCGAPAELGDVALAGPRVMAVTGGGGKDGGAPEDGGHTCVLLSDGTVKCWGTGKVGTQTGWLGQDLAATAWGDPSRIAPVQLERVVTRIQAGSLATCVIVAEPAGGLLCWGDDSAPIGVASGNVDYGTETGRTADKIDTIKAGSGKFVDVSVGVEHACAVTTDGEVYCWGYNTNGELGDGETLPMGTTRCAHEVRAPSEASLISNARTVSAGRYHTCALVTDDRRSVWCWGSNAWFALGIPDDPQPMDCGTLEDGEQVYGSVSTPRKTVTIDADIVQLAAAHKFNCILTDAGEVWCWGANDVGQLGDLTEPLVRAEALPVDLDGEVVTQIAARGSTACALTEQHEVWCWGSNQHGQAGTDSCKVDGGEKVEPRRIQF